MTRGCRFSHLKGVQNTDAWYQALYIMKLKSLTDI